MNLSEYEYKSVDEPELMAKVADSPRRMVIRARFLKERKSDTKAHKKCLVTTIMLEWISEWYVVIV